MLPGFKFLVATIFLSISVLIFGLGAAALLRSAHDEFVSIPSWRAAQQPMMAPAMDIAKFDNPRIDTSRPTLSLLRAEPAAPALPETKKTDDTKVASIDPKTATDAKVDAANSETAETDKPAVKKLRRSRNAGKRKRFARRARTAVAAQQQNFNSDPFAGFSTSVPLANPPRR